MTPRLLLTLLLALGLTGDGEKDGRRGNALYHDGLYEAAADAYYAGLATYQEGRVDAAYYGLQNNLGAALHKQDRYDMARTAFARAIERAPSPADAARTAYNAGNNEFRAEQAEAALDYYKRALRADPANADAKFNYEFVKRRLEQQQQQDPGQNQDQQNGDDEEQNRQGQDPQDQNRQGQDPQQQPDEQQQQPGEQRQQPPPEASDQLSRQQAERILQALENEEEQLLREVQKRKGRPRRVDKDW